MNHQDPFTAALVEEFRRIDLDLAGCGLADEDDRAIAGYLRSIRRRRQEIADVVSFAEQRTAQLERQIAGIENWQGPIVARIVRQKLQDQRAKSVNTPYGRAGFRHKKASISWDEADKDVILAWAKANCPEAVTVTQPRESILKTALVEARVKGAHIPGTTLIDEGDQFYIDVKLKQNGDGGVPAADESGSEA